MIDFPPLDFVCVCVCVLLKVLANGFSGIANELLAPAPRISPSLGLEKESSEMQGTWTITLLVRTPRWGILKQTALRFSWSARLSLGYFRSSEAQFVHVVVPGCSFSGLSTVAEIPPNNS